MFDVLICLFPCLLVAACVQINANACSVAHYAVAFAVQYVGSCAPLVKALNISI